MTNLNPLLLVGGVIGTVTAILIFAYALVKDKKETMGFERTMKDGEILRRLAGYAKPYWAKFVVVLFLMLFSIAYDIIAPLIVGALEELVAGEFALPRLFAGVAVYAGVLVFSMASTYFQAVILQRVGQRIISDLREDLFTHIESLAHEQLNEIPVGKLVTRVTNDTNAISMMFTNLLVTLAKNIFVILGILIAMLSLNYELTLMVLCFVPFIVIFTVIFRKFSRRAYRKVKDATTDINTYLSENLSGIKVTQIFGREDEKMAEFREKSQRLARANREQIFVFGVFLISLKTHGYCYGITSAIVSVFAVNFAFTYPYYAFDFFVEESILSAVIMLIVAVSTSTLNIRIRDQEKLRSENEKERMRGNLLRAISHDLRTPLTSIYGSSSTLISKYDALPKEQQLKLLGEIQEDSEWLIRMVENLLSVTRIDGAKVEVVKTPTVLDELIDSVLMKFSKKHPNQKVITQIPEEFVDIPMDSLLIEQVLLNLLENAVFHAKGMTELTLSVSLVGDKAVFEVADNGCGIPDDALQKIFTGSYEKSAAPVDGTRSNMGIGLSVCAAIVKAHGSDITAENRKSGGAVFRFALERGGEDYGQ